MMRSANPALNEKTFKNHINTSSDTAMTLNGTVHKTGLLLILTFIAASWTWEKFFTQGYSAVSMWMWIGAIGGLILGFVTFKNPAKAGITAPLYALFEGVFLGAISANFEMRFPGIVIQAVGLTFGTLAALLMAYRSGLIKATENFKLGVSAATGAIFMFYMASFVLGFFGINLPLLHSSGLLGIGISLVIVVVAALNLVLDFDFIENGVDKGAPKYMEWYGAFGLLVTLIWLYMEMLRLLSKLRSR